MERLNQFAFATYGLKGFYPKCLIIFMFSTKIRIRSLLLPFIISAVTFVRLDFMAGETRIVLALQISHT